MQSALLPLRLQVHERFDSRDLDLRSNGRRVGAPTVSYVRMGRGFLYLSRFAAAYREKFGESPSETLRHVQGDAGPTTLVRGPGARPARTAPHSALST